MLPGERPPVEGGWLVGNGGELLAGTGGGGAGGLASTG